MDYRTHLPLRTYFWFWSRLGFFVPRIMLRMVAIWVLAKGFLTELTKKVLELFNFVFLGSNS